DPLAVPMEEAAARGEGQLVPVHDVVTMVNALLRLSAGRVRSITSANKGKDGTAAFVLEMLRLRAGKSLMWKAPSTKAMQSSWIAA
ncbi:hypothetical protein R0G64_30970, partial [Pseudomonas otitidis]|nr:hypothetical protein [Pseudomonas otitidis]